MKKVAFGVLAVITVTITLVGLHDFWMPSTVHLKFRREDGRAAVSKYKDGGSFGLHVEIDGKREDVVFLDRRMVFPSPDSLAWKPKEDGLVYLGLQAMTAMNPMDLTSEVGREFEGLLRFERARWLVRGGYFGAEYRELLSEFSSAVDRTKQANHASAVPHLER